MKLGLDTQFDYDSRRGIVKFGGHGEMGNSPLIGRPDSVEAELRAAVESVLVFRAYRAEIMGQDLFGEPAWDILLALFAWDKGSGLAIHDVARRLNQSQASVHRWLSILSKRSLVRRNETVGATHFALTGKALNSLAALARNLPEGCDGSPGARQIQAVASDE
ncbi:MAG: winged helix-turn-helix transcriptional regulator [Sphingomonadaceae bacterium]|nr:winged helix-turn-helix transcriptional regulator [Sphingomonadaceae bacterium]